MTNDCRPPVAPFTPNDCPFSGVALLTQTKAPETPLTKYCLWKVVGVHLHRGEKPEWRTDEAAWIRGETSSRQI